MVINFAVFWVIAVILGGDALNGSKDAGTYYIASHGAERAVHPLVWYYSLIHSSVTLGSFLLFMAYKVLVGVLGRLLG
ncbi:hypothetical protein [Octadecabacter algicola]|uniref:hypothetical protein n=1 Tax=Octadecabacter algicola TaxID=2909342 RepID=UPI001F40DF07|nr:hypothetical protein [Octadecabacter algicola]